MSVRGRPGLLLFVLAVVLGSFAAVNAEITTTMVTSFAVVALLAIVVGEQVPMTVMGRSLAPLTTAPALGLVLAPLGDRSGVIPSGWTVLAVIWLSILAGGLVARVRGRSVVEGSLGSRFLGIAVTTALSRGIVVDGHNLVQWSYDERTHAVIGAVGLVLAALAGGLAERVLDSFVSWLGHRRPLSHLLAAEAGPIAGISVSTVATGPLIALAKPVLDWAAIPLLMVPVLLSYLSVRRLLTIRQSLDESLVAMSRLSELVGLTRPGHVNRVAELAVAIAQAMDLDPRTLRDVERTALLHDVGQLGLRQPLRGGATLHASGAEDADMARTVLRVVAGTPQLASLGPLLDQVRTPFRRTREFGEHIPIASRIVRVANAWDDITEGSRSPRIHTLALERLHLGLGYDYDPEVVGALERVLQQ